MTWLRAMRSVTFFVISLAAIQAEASICEYALGRASVGSVQVFSHHILNNEDKIRLRKILQTPITKSYSGFFNQEPDTFPYGEKKIEAFREAYVEARIRTFSPKDQENLRSILKWYPIVSFNDYDTGKFVANAEKVEMWKGFQDTILPYHSLAHEIEHQIQFYQFFGKSGREDWSEFVQALRFMTTRYLGVATTYKMELAAIQAEWEIGALATPEMLQRSREAVDSAKYTKLNRSLKKHFHRWINHSMFDREEYVHQEHKAGRYSIGQVSVYAGTSWIAAGAAIYQLFF